MAEKTLPQINPNSEVKVYERSDGYQDFTLTHARRLNENAPDRIDPFHWLEAEFNGRRMRLPLREGLMGQPDSNNLLRSGIKTIAFEQYDGMRLTYEQLVMPETSDKPEEYYLRTSTFGRMPKYKSGAPTPEAKLRLEGNARIENHQYRQIFTITGDDIRFDRLGIIRQIARGMGQALRMTEEAEVYDVITNTANYTRNSTTNDNDVGANTQALDLTHANLESALAIISTAKDRHTSAPLGAVADTIIVGPLMDYPIRKLLNSERVIAAGGDTNAQYGDMNVYRGAISRVIVSPFFSTSYDWALMDSRKSYLMMQRVENPTVLQESPTVQSEAWLTLDSLRYLAYTYFGVGFADDRCVAYFTSSTRPTL